MEADPAIPFDLEPLSAGEAALLDNAFRNPPTATPAESLPKLRDQYILRVRVDSRNTAVFFCFKWTAFGEPMSLSWTIPTVLIDSCELEYERLIAQAFFEFERARGISWRSSTIKRHLLPSQCEKC